MTLEEVQASISGHMDEILKHFKPGRKITVLVRSPEHPTQDFVMTDDEPTEIIAMLERRFYGAESGGGS